MYPPIRRFPLSPDFDSVYALTLAGGQSSRLFPFNKVLCDLTGSGRTLIEQAFDRATKTYDRGVYGRLIVPERFYVLTGETMVLPIRAQLHLPTRQFFVDPARRGTWPAILWAMAHLRRAGPDTVLAVLTSDHVIPNVSRFREGVARAVAWAQHHPAIVMLSVNPTPDPQDWKGFGTFRMGKVQGGPSVKAHAVEGFEEKPSLDRATQMVQESGWVWNAGMFFFRVQTAESALARRQPAMAEQYRALCRAIDRGQTALARSLYKKFPARIPHPRDPAREVDNTIDYALIAPLVDHPSAEARAYAIANALPEWADVGEWTALRRLVKPDRHGNVRVGRVSVDPRTHRCILAADQGTRIEARGLTDLLVAVADGSALIVGLRDAGKIKAIVGELAHHRGERVVELGAKGCRVRSRGGRVIVYGQTALEIRFAKNHLRVSLLPPPSVL